MANSIKIDIDLEGKDALTTIKSLEKSFNNFSKEGVKDVDKMDKAMSSFVGNLGAIATVKVFDFLRQEILASKDAFVEFESGLVSVAKTTNFSAKEIDQFSKEIEAMSKEIPASTGELLKIGEAAGQLGVKGVGNVSKFTEVIAKLGRVSNLEGEFAATTLTRILNVSREGIDTIDTFASVIVSLGNNFAATEAEIAYMTNEVARATAQFGFSAAESAALGTTLRSVGIRAEEAGGVLTKTFIKIDAAIRNGGKSLQQLEKITGLTGNEIKKQFGKEPEKLFQNFVQGLNRVQKANGDVNTELKKLGIEGIRVAKVLPTLAKNTDEYTRAIELKNREIKNATALDDEYGQILELTETKLTLFSNATTELSRNMFGKLAPAFNNLLDVTTAYFNYLTADGVVEEAKANIKGLNATIKDVGETTDFVNGFFGEDSWLGKINRSFADDRIKRINAELKETQQIVSATEGGAILEIDQDILRAEEALKSLKDTAGNKGFFDDVFPKGQTVLDAENNAIKEATENVNKLRAERTALADQRKAQAEYEASLNQKEIEDANKKSETKKEIAKTERDFFAELRLVREEEAALDREVQAEIAEQDKLAKEEKANADLTFLQDNLGKERALKELHRINDIEDEKKRKAALKKLNDQAVKESKASLLNLRKFEDLTNSQKVAAQKETLGTIATLGQSNNDFLFNIGKASSLTLAGINTAEGVTKALAAFPPPFNFAAAAAVGAAGAISIGQIASAKKPSAGSFANGGLIEGNSFSGDQMTANVNADEVIFNKRQQKNLFEGVNSGNIGGNGGGIVINNPVFMNEEMVDQTIDQINDRVEFGNKTLKAS